MSALPAPGFSFVTALVLAALTIVANLASDGKILWLAPELLAALTAQKFRGWFRFHQAQKAIELFCFTNQGDPVYAGDLR
jgi:hypothetical protein